MMAFLQILGSLGVFLFGMKVLSEGIQKTAGRKMRRIMATMTQNRFAGIFTGFLTTSLVQSSSATTVMTVSFVNAGLLTLVEAIGVIMGANLGTTLTAWIIAFVGKFSLSKVALPIVGIGLPLLFSGKDRFRHWGEVFIGFGLLFFGLGLLKEAVPDVKTILASDDADLKARAEQWLTMIKSLSGYGYFSLLIFLVGGVILTLCVQSSSAAMAITVTLAIQGWIGFHESCAIVLGENIGTTVTAYLASLGASTNAKRAARAHLLFNVIGVVWMLVVFYAFTRGVDWLGQHLPESFRTDKHESDIGFDLAIFHSSFNFINILLLVPFVPWLAKIVSRWVKDNQEPEGKRRLKYISRNLMELGELNLPEAENAINGMAKLTRRMFDSFVNVLNRPEEDMSEAVAALKEMEDDTDHLVEEITEYLVRCSAAEMSSEHAIQVTAMTRIAGELEEIADSIYRLGKYSERRKRHTIVPEAQESLSRMSGEVANFLGFACEKVFGHITSADIDEATRLEDALDNTKHELNASATTRIQNRGDVKAELLNIDLHNHMERIGNHCLNITQAALQMSENS